MATLFGVDLVPASVSHTATFLDAAETLVAHPVSALAVLGADGHVVGVFRGEDLLEGLFPAYLKELRHTAFAPDDEEALIGHGREVAHESVSAHMQPPVTVELETSATHAAERFLHCDVDALPVVRDGRFVGMLGRSELCRAMLRRAVAER